MGLAQWIEKFMLENAAKARAIQGMSKMELLAKAAEKAGQGAGGAIRLAKENPRTTAALAGGAAGYELGKPSDEEEEILKAYGL